MCKTSSIPDYRNSLPMLLYKNIMTSLMLKDTHDFFGGDVSQVAKEELSRECDYELEAANEKRFRSLISGKDGFYVPIVVDNLSSKKVLTTELVAG